MGPGARPLGLPDLLPELLSEFQSSFLLFFTQSHSRGTVSFGVLQAQAQGEALPADAEDDESADDDDEDEAVAEPSESLAEWCSALGGVVL